MKGQSRPTTHSASIKLRKQLTDAELKLWRRLKGEQLGAKFRRQHPFQRYVLDFVCLEKHLVIEVYGGHHADQQTSDQERTDSLRQAGFTVLRFWNNEVLNQTDDVVAKICRVLGAG